MKDYQPMRIAPTSAWCKEYPDHWAREHIGEIVMARLYESKTKPSRKSDFCGCRYVTLHPDEAEAKGLPRPELEKWLAECQLQAD